jgi:4-amino-4-deoxy-L-arabinose transferase-like glycosyltransferase
MSITSMSGPFSVGAAGQDLAASLSSPGVTRRLLVIVGIALLLRIVWAALVPVMPQSDVLAYDTFARTLVNHGVFGWTKDEPFSFWPPGTSLFYAFFYKVAGFDYLNIVIPNLVVAVGMIVCTARVVARFFGAQAALGSALILALWPTLIMLTTLLVSEPLFLFLTIAALDAWTLPQRSWLTRALIAGVLLGAATLVRPFAVLLPGVYAVAMLLSSGWSRETLRAQFQIAVLSTAALLCVVSPWTWRNYQLYGEFVLVSTNGGVTLWMGNSPGTDGNFRELPPEVKGMNDYQTNKVLGAEARRYILQDPLGFAGRTAVKLVRLYNNESIGALWNMNGITHAFGAEAVNWFKRFTQVTWALIFGLAAVGAVILARGVGVWRALVSPLSLLMIYFSVVHAVVITGGRYHLVAATQIAAFGGIAIASLLQRRRALPSLATGQRP